MLDKIMFYNIQRPVWVSMNEGISIIIGTKKITHYFSLLLENLRKMSMKNLEISNENSLTRPF